MSDSDEMNVLARAYLRGRANVPQSIRDAFAKLPRAPLAAAVEHLIAAQPNSDLVPLLKCIVEINQGRIKDLDVPAFVSYLIAECNTDEIQIRRVINAITSFQSLHDPSKVAEKQMLIAARDEENSGRKSTTRADILRLASKRIK